MSDPASKGLGYYSTFRIINAKLSYKGTENVAIYAFSLGKFLNDRVYACVKYLTNITSEQIHVDCRPKQTKASVAKPAEQGNKNRQNRSNR